VYHRWALLESVVESVEAASVEVTSVVTASVEAASAEALVEALAQVWALV
jgi:hypothetical protein